MEQSLTQSQQELQPLQAQLAAEQQQRQKVQQHLQEQQQQVAKLQQELEHADAVLKTECETSKELEQQVTDLTQQLQVYLRDIG